MYGSFHFEIWVYNPADLPNRIKYQVESYKTMKDFISTGNQGQGEIAAVSELTQPLVVFPYDYASLKILKSSQGAQVRISIDDNIKVGAELATATFYVLIANE
jgi:hypothetical protein